MRNKTFLEKHSETLIVLLLGLLIFGGLNTMMVLSAPPAWTDIHVGPWTAFHRNFTLSGFDQVTYVAITQWRPLFAHLRHPILIYMIWPLTELNTWLKDLYGINCAVYILATLWTLLSTLSWLLLYKIFRKIIGLGILQSLLLDLFYFSMAFVMLATFAPDHMLLTMTVLLSVIYLIGKAWKSGRQLSSWKVLILYFIGTGISTTNGVKIWLMDMVGNWRSKAWGKMLCRSLLYFIPTLMLAYMYSYQERTLRLEEYRYQKRVTAQAIKRDSVKFMEQRRDAKRREAIRRKKQIANYPIFEWTDTSIPIVPTLTENIFGEGIQLHEDYLLHDANREGQRPVIVKYRSWYNYLVEALIVFMFVAGIFVGRKERFMWVCMMPFIFDMFIHVGLRFALTDVYIMTAHWAFVIPIAIAYLVRKARDSKAFNIALLSTLALLTIYLWYHNLTLASYHLFNM